MTREHAQVSHSHRTRALIDIKLARALGDVFSSKQLRRAFGDILMTGAMKTPTAHSQLIPFFRHRIPCRWPRNPLIKGGLKQTHQGGFGHPVSKQPDSIDVGWVMRWGDAVERLHRFQHTLVQSHASIYTVGHHGFESHSPKLGFASNITAVLQLLETILNRDRVIGYSLEPS